MKIKERIHTNQHICNLDDATAEMFKVDSLLTTFKRTLELWRGNPNVNLFYKSLAPMDAERKVQKEVKLGWFIIHPFSLFRFLWEIVHCVVLFIGFIIIPLNLIYGKMLSPTLVQLGLTGFLECVEVACDYSYVLDFLMILITGYANVKDKMVYLSYKEIYRNYTSTIQFYIDIIAMISITAIMKIYMDYYTPEENLSWLLYVKLLSLLKFFRLPRFLKYFKTCTAGIYHKILVVKVIKYSLIYFICVHWLACIYIISEQYLMVFKMKPDEDLSIPSILHIYIPLQNYFDMYIYAHLAVAAHLFGIRMDKAVYFSYVQTNMWVFNLIVFLVGGTIGLVLTCIFTIAIIQIIISSSSSEMQYHSLLAEIRKFVQSKNLHKDMSQRIHSYYEYRFQKTYYQESTIKAHLSDLLLREVTIHSCSYLLKVVPIFSELQSEALAEVVDHLTREVYLYNDFIIQAGDNDTCMYFISSGTVAVTTQTGREICHLEDGGFFGEIAMILPDQRRVANVIAIEICELYKLERKAFLTCFEETSAFYKTIDSTARERHAKTVLLEELHKKYLLDRTTKRRFRGNMEQPIERRMSSILSETELDSY